MNKRKKRVMNKTRWVWVSTSSVLFLVLFELLLINCIWNDRVCLLFSECWCIVYVFVVFQCSFCELLIRIMFPLQQNSVVVSLSLCVWFFLFLSSSCDTCSVIIKVIFYIGPRGKWQAAHLATGVFISALQPQYNLHRDAASFHPSCVSWVRRPRARRGTPGTHLISVWTWRTFLHVSQDEHDLNFSTYLSSGMLQNAFTRYLSRNIAFEINLKVLS